MPPSDAAWQQKLAALRAHVAAHGRLPPNRDASGLGGWVSDQRQGKKAMDLKKEGKALRGMSPARAAALEGVPGWAWEVDAEAAWQERLDALRAFVAAHGRLPLRGDAAGLGAWVNTQRNAKKATDAGRKCEHKMTPARAAALEAVPGWAWEVDAETAWQERLDALHAYIGAHGRLPLKSHPSGLGVWVNSQRQAKKATDAGRKCRNKMTQERGAALESVPGWAWDEHAAAWQERLVALRAHVAAHGRLPPHRDASGLGVWVNSQRTAKKAAEAGRSLRQRMTPQRAAALEGVPGWAWEVDAEAAWEDKLAALRAYVAAHRRLPLWDDPSGLGAWVKSQLEGKKAMDLNKTGEALRGMTPARVAALEAVPGWAWAAYQKRAREQS